jgi:hypothetical protein
MIEKYEELNRIYEKYQHLHNPREEHYGEYQEALNVLLETIGTMINECEEIFDGMAESYCVIKDNEEELRILFGYEECV